MKIYAVLGIAMAMPVFCGAEGSAEAAGGNRVDRTHEAVSRFLSTTATKVDTFFDGENAVEEQAHTRLKLDYASIFSRKDSVADNLGMRARVHLPRLSRRVSLVFEGDDDVDTLENEPDDGFDDALDDATEDSVVGLQYLQRLNQNLHVKLTGGVRSDPQVFAGPRIRYRHAITDQWLARIVQDVRWYSKDGWEARTRFDADHILGTKWLWRNTLNLRWREAHRDEQGLVTTFGTSFTRMLPNGALRLQWYSQVASASRSQLDETVLAVRYRRQVWRDWLFLEVVPQIGFQERHDWAPNPALRLELELIFAESHG